MFESCLGKLRRGEPALRSTSSSSLKSSGHLRRESLRVEEGHQQQPIAPKLRAEDLPLPTGTGLAIAKEAEPSP